jgi:hypothetical protein
MEVHAKLFNMVSLVPKISSPPKSNEIVPNFQGLFSKVLKTRKMIFENFSQRSVTKFRYKSWNFNCQSPSTSVFISDFFVGSQTF